MARIFQRNDSADLQPKWRRYVPQNELYAPDGADMSLRFDSADLQSVPAKMNIHNNQVVDKIVTFPEDYYFRSARNYAGLKNELDVIVLDLF